MSNLDILNKANKELGAGNYEEFISYCSDDIQWENIGGRVFQGKVEVLEYIGSTYDGVVFTTDKYITEKDIVVELGQIVYEKDGVPKKSSYCDVWKFKDGLIHQVNSFVI